MLAKTLEITMTFENMVPDRVRLLTPNSTPGERFLLMGQKCSAVSIQSVPFAFVGSVKQNVPLVPPTILWECEDTNGTLIEGYPPWVSMTISGSVSYVTTKKPRSTETFQTISLTGDSASRGIRFTLMKAGDRMVGDTLLVSYLCTIVRGIIGANQGDDFMKDCPSSIVLSASEPEVDIAMPEGTAR